MRITPGAKKQAIKVKGFTVQIPLPYSRGHILAQEEADALNQHFARRVRANVNQSTIGPWKGQDEAQSAVDTYIETYAFGRHVTVRARTKDPVEKEALAIATHIVRAKADREGLRLSPAAIREMAKAEVDKTPKIMEHAEEIWKARQAAVAAVSVFEETS